jgi:hypothetical protein
MRLIAGIIAVGRELGYGGQAELLGRIGMQPLPYLSRVEVPRYDDELEFLFLDPCHVEPKFTRTINKMAGRLELDRVFKPNRRGAALPALSLGGK